MLRLVESAERIAGGPTAHLLATRAKALSVLGRHDEARDTVTALVALAAGGVECDTFGFWEPDQIHFAQSWVFAGAGDEAAADRAREQVLATTRDYQYDANVRLHEALCTVSKGGVDTGMRQAATVITTLPAAYRSHHIVQTGHLVLRAIPVDQRGRRTVGEFRELLGVGAGVVTA
ncbi:hypothetical protein ACQPZZ_14970 [Microbispora sp. CA-135349]|uniref:hypothetical protein n=1 Tax=Microbispora sp. CA-135349 TaxID=3239953 RepID=UPI003D8BE12A